MVTFWLHWFNGFERAKGLLCEIYIHCMRVFLLALASFLSLNLIAQTGKIAGKVISSKTGEALVGATITINTPARKALTDQTGRYTLGNLPSGNYTVIISYVGYDTKEVSDIAVKDADVTDLNINLDPRQSSLETVTVRSKARAETQGSLLIAQKNSAVVSDGVSSEIIRKTPDKNTGDVIKRVSGASIQDDRFAIIRGLNDRYNAAFLNGSPLPSTESDRKAFSFDIFPSNMLENLIISKTATADATGDFAGGIINITTKTIPTKGFTEISAGIGYNSIATFKDNKTYKGSGTDWLGFDNGTRQLPDGMPSRVNFPTTRDPRAALAKTFSNSWAVEDGTAGPNFNFQLSKGINIQRKGSDFLGMLLSVTYANTNNFTTGERNSFEYDRLAANPEAFHRNKFRDSLYTKETLLGVIANFNFKLNATNSISFKNMLSINGEDRVLRRVGYFDFAGNQEETISGSTLFFTSNRIYTGQLSGDHVLDKARSLKLNWMGSFANVYRQIPDMRLLFYTTTPSSPVPSAPIQNGTASNDNSGTRFFSETKEDIYSAKFDLSKAFGKGKNIETTLKLGGFYQNRDRSFDARLLAFGQYNSGLYPFDASLQGLPDNQIFNQNNMGQLSGNRGGFLLLDGSTSSDIYTASSQLTAGYLMADQRFGKKLRASYGVRLENFVQKLNTVINFTDVINLNTTKLDVLPSVNLIYSVTKKQNIRASYSKTVNRPEFRELAPFGFFNPVSRLFIYGNEALQRASIDNLDLRYEIYPGKSQVFSVSAFYKAFADPIELIADNANSNVAFYRNATSAKVNGFELEFRTLLNTVFGGDEASLLSKFTFSANAAFTWSKVTLPGDFGSNPLSKDIQTRPLQGQSPYVLNGSLFYSDENKGWGATLAVNRVGQRIAVIGSIITPDIWEQGRTVLDLQINKSILNKKVDLRLNIKDLLAQKLIMFYDINNSRNYDKGSDLIFSTNNFGRIISLNAAFKF